MATACKAFAQVCSPCQSRTKNNRLGQKSYACRYDAVVARIETSVCDPSGEKTKANSYRWEGDEDGRDDEDVDLALPFDGEGNVLVAGRHGGRSIAGAGAGITTLT